MQSRLNTPQHVIIVTHTLFYGASEALCDYLIFQKIQSLIYIGHPLLAENSTYTQRVYRKGSNVHTKSVKRMSAGSVTAFFRDALVTIIACAKLPKASYLYIGVNPLNACVGVLLRVFGIVDRVIFYAIDFSPKRSSNALINYIYHSMECFAIRYSDTCWNVSPRIEEGRKKFLGLKTTRDKQIVVPIGVWEKDIVKKIKAKNEYRLIFVGHLLEKQGVQEVIRAIPAVLKKLPKVSFTIIGGGEYEQPLRELVSSLSLEKYVQFMGWQSDQAVIRNEIIKSDIALATYMPSGRDTTNFSYYADPTKIKTYLSCGVPVLMTDVSYNAKSLMKSGVAVVVPYNHQDIARAIVTILSDTNALLRAKKAAREQARTFTWQKIFEKTFIRTIRSIY